jgi:glycosyltransferase involved in cell wall biosynthesis
MSAPRTHRPRAASERLRLLHVVTVPDSLLFFDGQLAFMKKHGFDITLVASPGPVLDEFGRREGVAVYPVEMARRMTPIEDLRSLAKIHRLIRRVRPHIAHTHTPKGGLLGTLAASLARTPVRIYQMRGRLSATATGWKRSPIMATERIVCAASCHVICNSHSLREGAIRDGLCPAEKIEVLLAGSGNGVDSAVRFNPSRVGTAEASAVRKELGIPDAAPVIGFVGRLVREKGIGELVQSWKVVREKCPDAHLMLVGPLEPRDPISGADKQLLKADPRVRLVGFRNDLPQLYKSMDVVVLPTYREGFPNVLLEAQAMALPVVSTRAEGSVDAVEDGVTGILVPPRESAPLTRATLAYLDDASLRARHGAAGRDRVLRLFERERLWEALLARYESLLRAVGPVAGWSAGEAVSMGDSVNY